MEKVKNDFGIDIPGLPSDEDFDVDGYFDDLASRIEELDRWSVDRGSVVLGFFSFGKFLMYRDLDPTTWPDGTGYGPSESGKYAYYICQSLAKRGSGACSAPKLNAKRFEQLIVDQIRENILTESNIRDLVQMVDEEMDGVAREQRDQHEAIQGELAEVRRRLDRLWHAVETTELGIDDIAPRIREHRERQERLEVAAEEVRSLLSER